MRLARNRRAPVAFAPAVVVAAMAGIAPAVVVTTGVARVAVVVETTAVGPARRVSPAGKAGLRHQASTTIPIITGP